MRNLGNYRTG